MLKEIEVIGVASTGAYEGVASLVTRTKIVRIARLGFWRYVSEWSVSPQAATAAEGAEACEEAERRAAGWECKPRRTAAAPTGARR
jgi:hypothetical protein